MKVEINVPDNLPQYRLKKEIQDFEQRLKIEAQLTNKNPSKPLNLAERINLRFAEFEDITIPEITRDEIRNNIDFN